MKKLTFASILFVLGEIFDIISTYIALNMGFTESNRYFNSNWLMTIIYKIFVTVMGVMIIQYYKDDKIMKISKWIIAGVAWCPVIFNTTIILLFGV